MHNLIKVVAVCGFCLSFSLGCKQTIPKEALALSADSLKLRQLQTRRFETNRDTRVVRATVGVLQDLGYNLEETESTLGIVTGSKDRNAVETGQVGGAIFFGALTGSALSIDTKQKIKASAVIRKNAKNTSYILVRVTFHRIVWNSRNAISKLERLEDPKLYQEFFTRLSKSVFLEANSI